MLSLIGLPAFAAKSPKTTSTVCFTVLLAVLLSSCAAPSIQPVTDPSKPFIGYGFSISPPSGENWYVQENSLLDMVSFGKYRLGGTVLVAAHRRKVRNHDIRTPEGLRLEFKDYVDRHSSNMTPFNVVIEPYRDDELGTDCVRVETSTEERNNPYYPGEVLLMTDIGKACRYPSSSDYFAYVGYSERRPVGATSLIDETLRKECEDSVKSFRFLPNQ